jgi:hypothetical protein
MEKTCPRCGYQRTFCQCGRSRNADGSIRRKPYDDYSREPEDYSRTARIERRRDAQRKWNIDRLPVNAEQLITYIQRSDKPVQALQEYAMHRHLYGTSKTWPCHTQGRHCPVCDLCQESEILRQLLIKMMQKYGTETERLYIHEIYASDDPNDIDRVELSFDPPSSVSTSED